MITIEISIPSEIANDVVEAFGSRFDYDRHKEGGESKVEFAKRQVRVMIAQTYTSYMEEQATREAGSTAAVAAYTASSAITVQ